MFSQLFSGITCYSPKRIFIVYKNKKLFKNNNKKKYIKNNGTKILYNYCHENPVIVTTFIWKKYQSYQLLESMETSLPFVLRSINGQQQFKYKSNISTIHSGTFYFLRMLYNY